MYFYRDLTGMKFGKLTAIKVVGRSKARKLMWLCECECGKTNIVTGSDLTSGKTKSCGCSKVERMRKQSLTHGQSGTRIYGIWRGMKTRCYNPKFHEFRNYGGRGISMCKEWTDDFCKFEDWALHNGYNEKLTIERIDVNGNYEPSNCRWATIQEQANNRTSNHLLTFNGKTMNIAEWAREVGIKDKLLRRRIRDGWTTDRALTQPVKTLCRKKLY